MELFLLCYSQDVKWDFLATETVRLYCGQGCGRSCSLAAGVRDPINILNCKQVPVFGTHYSDFMLIVKSAKVHEFVYGNIKKHILDKCCRHHTMI